MVNYYWSMLTDSPTRFWACIHWRFIRGRWARRLCRSRRGRRSKPGRSNWWCSWWSHSWWRHHSAHIKCLSDKWGNVFLHDIFDKIQLLCLFLFNMDFRLQMRCWRAESGGQWNFFNTTIFIIMLWRAHGRHDTATLKGQNQEIDPNF